MIFFALLTLFNLIICYFIFRMAKGRIERNARIRNKIYATISGLLTIGYFFWDVHIDVNTFGYDRFGLIGVAFLFILAYAFTILISLMISYYHKIPLDFKNTNIT